MTNLYDSAAVSSTQEALRDANSGILQNDSLVSLVTVMQSYKLYGSYASNGQKKPSCWLYQNLLTLYCSSKRSPRPSHCQTGCRGGDLCGLWHLCSLESLGATLSIFENEFKTNKHTVEDSS